MKFTSRATILLAVALVVSLYFETVDAKASKKLRQRKKRQTETLETEDAGTVDERREEEGLEKDENEDEDVWEDAWQTDEDEKELESELAALEAEFAEEDADLDTEDMYGENGYFLLDDEEDQEDDADVTDGFWDGLLNMFNFGKDSGWEEDVEDQWNEFEDEAAKDEDGYLTGEMYEDFDTDGKGYDELDTTNTEDSNANIKIEVINMNKEKKQKLKRKKRNADRVKRSVKVPDADRPLYRFKRI